MHTIRYVLFYSNRSKRYKLAKVKADNFNPRNPEVLWIFNEDKLKIAKRIMHNMNLAASTPENFELRVAELSAR